MAAHTHIAPHVQAVHKYISRSQGESTPQEELLLHKYISKCIPERLHVAKFIQGYEVWDILFYSVNVPVLVALWAEMLTHAGYSSSIDYPYNLDIACRMISTYTVSWSRVSGQHWHLYSMQISQAFTRGRLRCFFRRLQQPPCTFTPLASSTVRPGIMFPTLGCERVLVHGNMR